MTRAGWDALAPEFKREEGERCYLVDPTGAASPILVEFTTHTTARPGATTRPGIDEVHALERDLSRRLGVGLPARPRPDDC